MVVIVLEKVPERDFLKQVPKRPALMANGPAHRFFPTSDGLGLCPPLSLLALIGGKGLSPSLMWPLRQGDCSYLRGRQDCSETQVQHWGVGPGSGSELSTLSRSETSSQACYFSL